MHTQQEKPFPRGPQAPTISFRNRRQPEDFFLCPSEVKGYTEDINLIGATGGSTTLATVQVR